MKNKNLLHKKQYKITPTKLSYLIDLPKITDEGYLCFAEGDTHLPFQIKRFYYIFDVIENAKRGFHAHRKTRQVLFCLSGSIKIILDNGNEREEVVLNKPHQGIFLDKMMWHEMVDFKKDTVLFVAASEYYAEPDYIRDYDTFCQLVKQQGEHAYKWYQLPKRYASLTYLRNFAERTLPFLHL